MSIASRITAITGHITDIYDTLELGGDTTQNKNIVNINTEIKREYKNFLANGTDTLWNNWEKVSGTGETLSLSPTIKGKMKVDLKGNTYQYNTTGKNLLPTQVDKWEQGSISTDGNLSSTTRIRTIDYYPVSNNVNYHVSIQNTNYCFLNIYLYNSNKQYIGQYYELYEEINGTTDMTINIPSYYASNLAYMRVIIRNVDNVSTIVPSEITTIKPQIELGTTKTSWEEYTGNQPSPNPDYPQDIQVVSGDNTIKVSGENKFDKDNPNVIEGYIAKSNATIYLSNNQIIIYVPCQPNTTYYVKKELVSTPNNNVFRIGTTSTIPTSGSVLSQFYVPDNEETATDYTFTTNANAQYIVWYCYVRESLDLIKDGVYIGECTTYPISLGNIELCKIGTYQDKIAKSTGKNLFDKSSATQGYYYNESLVYTSVSNTQISDYIKVNSGSDYTVSYTKMNSSETTIRINYFNGNKEIQQQITDISTTSGYRTYTFTIPNNIEYVRFSTTTNQIYIDQNTIQFEKGNQATPYEPYGKVWYLNKQIGKVVLDGSENWTRHSNTRQLYYLSTSGFNMLEPPNNAQIMKGLSNYFTPIAYYIDGSSDLFGDENGIAISLDHRLYFGAKEISSVSDLTTWENWLSTHNTEVYYVLATPTYEEITDTTLLSQLEALAYSYDEQTNISQVNDDMPFVLDITALKEMS